MNLVVYAVVYLAPQVSGYGGGADPNIPGAGSIMAVANTFAIWGLIGAVIALIAGAVTFGFARAAGNALVMGGALGVLFAAGLAAALIGGAEIWVNHLANFGAAWH